jgi:hypothetical protein
MNQEEGFPPHVVGFMRRRREKEKQQEQPSDQTRPISSASPREAR